MRWLGHPRRLCIAAIVALVVWLGAMLVAPLSLAPGSVAGLDGRENHIDHWDLWLQLPAPQAATYAIGDLLCHQKAWRTFSLNGNELPVDERMTAIFAAALPGLALALRATPGPYIGRALDSLFGRERSVRAAARGWTIVTLVCLAPAAIDLAWENILGHESTMLSRVITGSIAGVAGGLVLGAFLTSLDHVFGARFLRPSRAEA